MTNNALQRQWLPNRVEAEPAGSATQLAFSRAIQEVAALREELQRLRASQAATRQAYWQQVGRVAAAAVAARRALYTPLEVALTSGYLNRAEEQQVTELLVHNARSLQERFGEDEATILARYAPPLPPLEEEPAAQPLANPALPPHEQAAAAARTRRQQQRQQARGVVEQATELENQALLENTKAAYRQLARLHHPDRAAQANAATQQAQTELMQQITAAYAANDLAALLSLLAATNALATMESEALLKRYTKALTQELAQLSQQLVAASQPDEHAPWSGTEKQQRTRLREIKRSLRAEIEYLAQLAWHMREPASLRQLLRELAAAGQEGF